MKMLNFVQFVNEAQIKDKTIIAKLDRIHELKARIKELTAETKAIDTELKAFDADIKPIFDAMKFLNDKLATTERYVVKITRYGGEGTAVSYGKAVEQALALVSEEAQAIINECVRQNTAASAVKHSFEIERVQEAKMTDAIKAVAVKLAGKVKSIVEKFTSFFDKKIAKIDQANEKLAAMLK